MKSITRISTARSHETIGAHNASLAARAYALIEDLIVRLELRPGLLISEASLSASLGIGRTPIREALQRLEREGLVAISPRRGASVTEIRPDAQLRLLEVRRSLERLMAARAALRAEPAQRERFFEIASAMREAGRSDDDVRFLALDLEFNQFVSAIAANEYATSAINLTAGLSRRFWFRFYHSLADLPRSCNLHADVATAIAEGNADEASQASDRLLDYIEIFTQKVSQSFR